MKTISLKIISPSGELYNGSVAHATFPGANGAFAVFPMHAPLISALEAGEIKYTLPGGQESSMSIGGGFIEVKDDTITVCVD